MREKGCTYNCCQVTIRKIEETQIRKSRSCDGIAQANGRIEVGAGVGCSKPCRIAKWNTDGRRETKEIKSTLEWSGGQP